MLDINRMINDRNYLLVQEIDTLMEHVNNVQDGMKRLDDVKQSYL